jgi:hypothetical protein
MHISIQLDTYLKYHKNAMFLHMGVTFFTLSKIANQLVVCLKSAGNS